MTSVHRDFEEFFALLRGKNVAFMVIGGVAFNYHARPRATKDIDIWVKPSNDNLSALIDVIAAFGFPAQDLDPDTLAAGAEVLMLGRAPYRIDILTAPQGVEWDSAWSDVVEASYGNTPIYVMGRDALIASKRAAGRPRDLADVLELEAMNEVDG